MSADTDKLLALARECGASVELGIEVGPEKVYFVEMAVDQLAALEQRIRQDERERAATICEQWSLREVRGDMGAVMRSKVAQDRATAAYLA